MPAYHTSREADPPTVRRMTNMMRAYSGAVGVGGARGADPPASVAPDASLSRLMSPLQRDMVASAAHPERDPPVAALHTAVSAVRRARRKRRAAAVGARARVAGMQAGLTYTSRQSERAALATQRYASTAHVMAVVDDVRALEAGDAARARARSRAAAAARAAEAAAARALTAARLAIMVEEVASEETAASLTRERLPRRMPLSPSPTRRKRGADQWLGPRVVGSPARSASAGGDGSRGASPALSALHERGESRASGGAVAAEPDSRPLSPSSALSGARVLGGLGGGIALRDARTLGPAQYFPQPREYEVLARPARRRRHRGQHAARLATVTLDAESLGLPPTVSEVSLASAAGAVAGFGASSSLLSLRSEWTDGGSGGDEYAGGGVEGQWRASLRRRAPVGDALAGGGDGSGANPSASAVLLDSTTLHAYLEALGDGEGLDVATALAGSGFALPLLSLGTPLTSPQATPAPAAAGASAGGGAPAAVLRAPRVAAFPAPWQALPDGEVTPTIPGFPVSFPQRYFGPRGPSAGGAPETTGAAARRGERAASASPASSLDSSAPSPAS